MDKFAEQFNKASHVLLDAEVKLNSIAAQLNAVEKDIAILNVIESKLVENIKWMKRKRMIVAAGEFKKATKDLETCRGRRSLLKIDYDNTMKIYKNAEAIHNNAKLEYEQAYKAIHDPYSNVIQVDFRKKDGKI